MLFTSHIPLEMALKWTDPASPPLSYLLRSRPLLQGIGVCGWIAGWKVMEEGGGVLVIPAVTAMRLVETFCRGGA